MPLRKGCEAITRKNRAPDRKTPGGNRRIVDCKGRVTLPAKLRQQLDLYPGAEIEFLAGEDGKWYVRRVDIQSNCRCCGRQVNLVTIGKDTMCRECAEKYYRALGKKLGLGNVGKGGNLDNKRGNKR
ncbi:AbrB/MazE/SpoVT family DNA-binding domain-containing protein [Neomoorella thermoacetica]|uniref:AbrB/MazE/SpoVT family DNA-binding domain-containing protein n=1 Tax=Neomoorella thermoacetica TaxID=1525 RepID=UPI0030CE0407